MNGEYSPGVAALDRLIEWKRKNGRPQKSLNKKSMKMTYEKRTILINANTFEKGTSARLHPYQSDENILNTIDEKIEAENFEVVNAPRPLPGDIEWQGDFRHGIFYVAGDPEIYGEQWDALDAWPVELIDNGDVEKIICSRIKKAGYNLAKALEENTYEDLADMYNLPWRKEN